MSRPSSIPRLLVGAALLALTGCDASELPGRRPEGDIVTAVALVGRICAAESASFSFDAGGGPIADSGCEMPLTEEPVTFVLSDGSLVKAMPDETGRFRAEIPAERRLTHVITSCGGGRHRYQLEVLAYDGSDPLGGKSEHRLALTLPYSLCAPWAPGPAVSSRCQRSVVEAAYEALRARNQVLSVYVEDGAADGTVLVLRENGGPLAELGPLLDCPREAAAFLIEQLDDARPSPFTCRTSETDRRDAPVPMAHVALDVLLGLTSLEDGPVVVPDCADDGLGACIAEAYYFRPDAYELVGEELRLAPEVAQVQANWKRLLESGEVRFERPSWLDAP